MTLPVVIRRRFVAALLMAHAVFWGGFALFPGLQAEPWTTSDRLAYAAFVAVALCSIAAAVLEWRSRVIVSTDAIDIRNWFTRAVVPWGHIRALTFRSSGASGYCVFVERRHGGSIRCAAVLPGERNLARFRAAIRDAGRDDLDQIDSSRERAADRDPNAAPISMRETFRAVPSALRQPRVVGRLAVWVAVTSAGLLVLSAIGWDVDWPLVVMVGTMVSLDAARREVWRRRQRAAGSEGRQT